MSDDVPGVKKEKREMRSGREKRGRKERETEGESVAASSNPRAEVGNPSPSVTRTWIEEGTTTSKGMGGKFSKVTDQSPPAIRTTSNSPCTADRSPSEFACRRGPDLQTFDTALHARTNLGILLRSLSSDSFRQVSSSLLDMNHQEDPTIILESMKDIWENPQLFDLVKDFIDKSLHKSDFLMPLESCLKWAREALLQHFEAEESGSTSNTEQYSKMSEELKNFKAPRSPFPIDFLEKLQLCKTNINKRLESAKRRRKISCIIFASVFLAVVICAVVTSAVAAPPVGAALAAATSLPLLPMIQWLHSLWKDSDVALEEQKRIISSMLAGTYVANEGMKSIQPLVDKLKIEIEQSQKVADDSPRDEEAARFETDQIKKKLGVFKKSLEDRGNHINCCIEKIGSSISI